MRQMDDLPSTEALATGLDWLQEIDLRATLLGLGVPVLVFHGTADSLIPPIAGRWIADHVARGRFVAVEGAAHAPFWGRTDFMAGGDSPLSVPAKSKDRNGVGVIQRSSGQRTQPMSSRLLP